MTPHDRRELPFTPETIISDRSDARLLVFGLLLAWGAIIVFTVGERQGWPVLIVAATVVGGLGVLRTQMLVWRVARRLRPLNKDKVGASSFDEFNVNLNLLRPSVIKRAFRLFR